MNDLHDEQLRVTRGAGFAPASGNGAGAVGGKDKGLSAQQKSNNNRNEKRKEKQSDPDWVKTATCKICGVTGHISPTCPSRNNRTADTSGGAQPRPGTAVQAWMIMFLLLIRGLRRIWFLISAVLRIWSLTLKRALFHVA